MTDMEKVISVMLGKEIKIEKIINSKKSESTNSCYFVIKMSDGNIYQLSFSDHSSSNHVGNLKQLQSELNAKKIDMDLTEVIYLFIGPYDVYNYHNTQPDYYGISLAKPYDFDASSLVNKYALQQAFVSNAYTIKSSELVENNLALKITYRNFTDTYEETEYYTNFVPIVTDLSQIALIKYLLENNDASEVRNLYYDHNDIKSVPVDEYIKQLRVNHSDEEIKSEKLLDLKSNHPDDPSDPFYFVLNDEKFVLQKVAK